MDHYIDLRLRPDPEFPAPQLLNALAAKLHRALVALKAQDIGVSFPRHNTKGTGLGDVLRLHSTKERLQNLMQTPWLSGMSDHVEYVGVEQVPVGAQHRVVRRMQVKSNADRLRRRQIKRHGLTPEQAQEQVPDSIEKRLNLPFLTLRSQSTGQHFHLFIEHCPCQQASSVGVFNAYGLSAQATVPWF